MPTVEVQHSFQGVSGDAKDQYINTFHFIHADPIDETAIGELAVLLQSFYKLTTDAGGAIAEYYSGQCMGAGEHIKMYDISQPKPRSPIYDALNPAAVIAPIGAQNLPDQVSAVLSMEAWLSGLGVDETPGPTNIARRRGRIYLGPLNANVLDASGRTQSRIKEIFPRIVVAAATRLMADGISAGWTWVVYSRANNMSYTLARVWMNDAFDTQRRRALRPVSKAEANGPPFFVG